MPYCVQKQSSKHLLKYVITIARLWKWFWRKNLIYVAGVCNTKIHIRNYQIIQQKDHRAKILKITFISLVFSYNCLRLEEARKSHVDQLHLPWFHIHLFKVTILFRGRHLSSGSFHQMSNCLIRCFMSIIVKTV